MNKLDNLMNKVIEEAEKEAETILAEKAQENTALIEEKKRLATIEVEQLLIRAEREAVALKEQAISQASLQARDEQLFAKREIIERVFSLALERLTNLDDATYRKFIETRVSAKPLQGTEVLIVPKGKKALIDDLKLPIDIVEEEKLDSGFQLKDDNITMNYSFSSMLEFYQDELELDIVGVLFTD